MKRILAVALLLIAIATGRGQEAELAPIVVTGTFELRQGPSLTDLFTLHLQKQIDARRAADEALARSPLFNAKFWSYIPMRIESSSSDPALFFTPRYLTSEYQNADQALRKLEKQSVFER